MPFRLRTAVTGLSLVTATAGAVAITAPSACGAVTAGTILIASSASAVTDATGTTWSAGHGFIGGAVATNAAPTVDIKGTTDDALYRTETYGMSSFSQPVANGTYDVTLRMAENYWGATGKRVFSVTAEGGPALSDVDIYAAVGKNAAYDRTFRVAVTDGSLDLGFTAKVNKALVDAVRITPVDTTPPDTAITSATTTGSASAGTATVAFTATEPGTARCSVDGGAWSPCTSPVTYPGLPLGNHTVAVRATDAAGNTDPTPATRTLCVKETHDGWVRPDASNTGVPKGTVLTRRDGDLTITTPGAVYSGLDIHGFVVIKAPNVTIKNSIIRGGVATGNRGLVQNTDPAATNFVLQDSELVPEFPSVWLDGMKGANYTLLRDNIHGGVDGAKVYGDHVRIESSWIHDTQWYANDPNQGGTQTHNDGVQVLGGKDIRIFGNDISGASNTALMVTQDYSATTDMVFNDNWVDGGNCTINMAHKKLASMSGLTVSHNRFGHSSALACPVIASTMTTVTTDDDAYDDTGLPVLVRHNGA